MEKRIRGLSPHQKALGSSVFLFIFLTILFLPFSLMFMEQGFNHLEQEAARRDLERARSLVEHEAEGLSQLVSGYAMWDDMYSFVTGVKVPGFIERNFYDGFYLSTRISLVLILGTNGNVLYQAGFNPDLNQHVDYFGDLDDFLARYPPLNVSETPGPMRTGIINANGQLMIVAASPVTNSVGEAFPRGLLIIGQAIDQWEKDRILRISGQNIELVPLDSSLPPDFSEAHRVLQGGETAWVKTVDKDYFAAYGYLQDINGNPALLLKTLYPRELYKQSLPTRLVYAYSFLMPLLLLCTLFYFAVRGYFISQMANQETARALRESRERYELAVNGSNDGIWDWELETDVIYFSDRWKDQIGCTPDSIGTIPEEWFNRVHPDDLIHLRAQLADHIRQASDQFMCEYRILHRDGAYRWMQGRGRAVYDPQGIALRIAGSQTDITERKRIEEQMMRNALYDPLTDLPNRTLFIDRLTLALERYKRRPENILGIIGVSINRFKIINETYGHAAGDRILAEFGSRLKKIARRSVDTIARLSGDEFGILLDDTHSAQDVIDAADRVQAEMHTPFMVDNHLVFLAARMGIVIPHAGYENAEEVMRDVNVATNFVKQVHLTEYVLYDPKMRSQIIDRLALEADLRHAIEHDELLLYYQPIYTLEKHDICGFEALLRWQHPQRGMVMPGDFVSIAEQTGLIVPIGRWVLRRACQQVSQWQKRYPQQPALKLFVNLSSVQFSDPELLSTVRDALHSNEMPADSLSIEITESVLMEDIDRILPILHSLKDMGTQVEIDDFGTGYSSFSYLQQLPVDGIKIDRSFISRLEDRNQQHIVQTLIDLARKLGYHEIAEGVETPIQMERLREMGCTFVQGYLFSRPSPQADIEALLEKRSQAGMSHIL